MQQIVEFVKNYFIFLLVLYLFSYLAPKENYRKYFRFFVSALMIAVLMKPVLGFLQKDAKDAAKAQLGTIGSRLEEHKYEEKGEDVFEWFWEREGVDYKAFEPERKCFENSINRVFFFIYIILFIIIF